MVIGHSKGAAAGATAPPGWLVPCLVGDDQLAELAALAHGAEGIAHHPDQSASTVLAIASIAKGAALSTIRPSRENERSTAAT